MQKATRVSASSLSLVRLARFLARRVRTVIGKCSSNDRALPSNAHRVLVAQPSGLGAVARAAFRAKLGATSKGLGSALCHLNGALDVAWSTLFVCLEEVTRDLVHDPPSPFVHRALFAVADKLEHVPQRLVVHERSKAART